ncbi:hypothetical protein SCP_1401050 [Sparassis crispa]|uniref:Uncharacterized protein n=1 Tax=Sparassis crispa TaxID=139825 RepID=A0A401H2V9_9APHY|nr:hypothetical protein SCP_1401050 [Sparassis crispa]GBE88700.1 hypothetical protein SCP_1401050 [Sparassis crispa]
MYDEYQQVRLSPSLNMGLLRNLYSYPLVNGVHALLLDVYQNQHAKDHGLDSAAYLWTKDLADFLPRFNYVRDVTIQNIVWGIVARPTREVFLNHFSMIGRLELTHVDFWNTHQFLRVLDAFPRVQWLCVTDISFQWVNHTQRQVSGTVPRAFHHLHYQGKGLSIFVDWLLGDGRDVFIEELIIRSNYPDLEDLVKLFTRLAPHLASFAFEQFPEQEWNACLDNELLTKDEHLVGPSREGTSSNNSDGVKKRITERQVIYDPEDDYKEDPAEDSGMRLTRLVERLQQNENVKRTTAYTKMEKDIGYEPPEALAQSFRMDALENIVAQLHWGDITLLTIDIMGQLVSSRTRLFNLELTFEDLDDLMSLPQELDPVLDDITLQASHNSDFTVVFRSSIQVNDAKFLQEMIIANLPRARVNPLLKFVFDIRETAGGRTEAHVLQDVLPRITPFEFHVLSTLDVGGAQLQPSAGPMRLPESHPQPVAGSPQYSSPLAGFGSLVMDASHVVSSTRPPPHAQAGVLYQAAVPQQRHFHPADDHCNIAGSSGVVFSPQLDTYAGVSYPQQAGGSFQHRSSPGDVFGLSFDPPQFSGLSQPHAVAEGMSIQPVARILQCQPQPDYVPSTGEQRERMVDCIVHRSPGRGKGTTREA